MDYEGNLRVSFSLLLLVQGGSGPLQQDGATGMPGAKLMRFVKEADSQKISIHNYVRYIYQVGQRLGAQGSSLFALTVASTPALPEMLLLIVYGGVRNLLALFVHACGSHCSCLAVG
jgi:hypothetical protein